MLSDHYSYDILSDFSVGKLTLDLAEQIEQHLATCNACRQLLESIPRALPDTRLRQAAGGPHGMGVGIESSQTAFDETQSLVGRDTALSTSPDASTVVLNSEYKQSASTQSVSQTYLPPSTDKVLQSRYRIMRMLGEGAFGRVYLAVDLELERHVAIKVPRPERFVSNKDTESYLAEARLVASLNHPHIVPIYDTGRTSDGMLFVVSRFIEGTTLDAHAKQNSLDPKVSASIVKTVALALDYAHARRLIHRDVKPANILMELSTNAPYVTDFGLAIREEDYAIASRGGSPAYMSPEQVRGEGHRLDGRSDVFALGVVLYELLTQQRPFSGSNLPELFHQIIMVQPKAPRELVGSLHPELERICMKALSKQVSDRYTSAASMAHDLDQWLADKPKQVLTNASDGAVQHKGLRAYDASDVAYFLSLLPGTRESDGLPQQVSFWKTKIEETDPQSTFAVGLILGPSGCGKSSMVRAGLLPCVDSRIKTLYIEATSADTETRLLGGLHKLYPALKNVHAIDEALTRLRRTPGSKVTIVIDQFEQWLHARSLQADEPLVQALRQCDGGQVQAILMIRDDFSMAAARLMRLLDIRILEGVNFATVDLFDTSHAATVLTRFGQSFGQIPRDLSTQADSTRKFIDQVVAGLAREGKVISVQLALFAEMVKDKPWTLPTLESVGGTEGVGINFLEKTFSSRGANPEIRLHAAAARAVLRALLPDAATDIKGHRRSHSELLALSGYQHRPDDFKTLLDILDNQLRLITPTEADQSAPETQHRLDPDSISHYYQLTHDYLVPALREWLTRKQRETKAGRAELKLAERAAAWGLNHESRQLPNLIEWLQIRCWTEPAKWKASEKAVMQQASHFHGQRVALAAAMFLLLVLGGWFVWGEVARQREETRIAGLVETLFNAEPARIPEIVTQLAANPDVADRMLEGQLSLNAQTPAQLRAQLHARLASVSRDAALVEPLKEEMLAGKLNYFLPIRELLRPVADKMTASLLTMFRDDQVDAQRRFRAALALAGYVSAADNTTWTESQRTFVSQQLVSSNAELQPMLREALRPIQAYLQVDLERIFADTAATDAQRLGAANALADYAAEDRMRLTRLLTLATPEQYAVLYPLVSVVPSPETITQLSEISATLPPDDLGSVPRIAYGQRRANAAVTMLKLGEKEKILPVFEWTDDPEALTQFIFRCKPRGIDVDMLLDLLDLLAKAPSGKYPQDARYAALLAIGEYAPSEILPARRAVLVRQLADLYANDPSSGVHGAAGWLLRHLGEKALADRVDQTPVPYSPDREWFTLAIKVRPKPPTKPEPAAQRESSQSIAPKTFYFTFVVYPQAQYTLGSVKDEVDRQEDEIRHTVRLTRPFAILDREITLEELIAFSPRYAQFVEQYDAQPNCAGFGADWYTAVAYCRWLGREMGLAESEQCYADPKTLDEETYARDPQEPWAPRNWPLDLDKRGFRLPTEAEWEIAARSGSRTAYGFGSDTELLNRFGWFINNSGKHGHPGRELRPSTRGLFDLHGNVYEWTHDWHEVLEEPAAQTDPLGAPTGTNRVSRGGGWGSGTISTRTASRYNLTPSYHGTVNGFRLALVPTSQ